MWIPCFMPLYSPLNLYLIILWILDFKYILLLLLLLLLLLSCNDNGYKFEFKICSPNRHVSKILAKKVKC